MPKRAAPGTYRKRKNPRSGQPVVRPKVDVAAAPPITFGVGWLVLAGVIVVLLIGLTVVLTLAFSGGFSPNAPGTPLPTLPSPTTSTVAGTTPSSTTTTLDVSG